MKTPWHEWDTSRWYWRLLRRFGVYPYNVVTWRNRFARAFHFCTFWVFCSREKELAKLEAHMRKLRPTLPLLIGEEKWEELQAREQR